MSLFDKSLVIGAHALAGNGIGRYATSLLPDATAHPDGSLELLTGGSGLGSVEWHGSSRLDLYAYYGGEYAKPRPALASVWDAACCHCKACP